MAEHPVVNGIALTFMVDPALDGLQDRYEVMGRDRFYDRYGYRAEHLLWRFEAASVWTDPETGGDYEVPDRWMLLVEGRRPDDTPPSVDC